jgi:hypothetical protein
MGGTQNGISRENLKKCLIISYKFVNDSKNFLIEEIGNAKYNTNSSNLKENHLNLEVDEIMQYLCTSEKDTITLKEFINAMTCIGGFPNEDLSFFDA